MATEFLLNMSAPPMSRPSSSSMLALESDAMVAVLGAGRGGFCSERRLYRLLME